MDKSKWFAVIISVPLLSFAVLAYAETRFDPPTLVVSKPAQPVSGPVPAAALHVPFTHADLTARGTDIVIDDITVVKIGVSDDEVFDDILLLDDKGTVLSEGTLDDDHTVHFTDAIYVPRNTTLRIVVAANMADDLSEFEGQTAGFAITHIASHGHIPVQ